MAVSDAIHEHLTAVTKARAERLESDLAEAMAAQDFNKLDRLIVVHCDGCPPAVASWLGEELF